MKQQTVQKHINLKIPSTVAHNKATPLENLVKHNTKIYQLEKIVNWKLLEDELGYLFESDHAPSPRLILGLLYLQSIDNLPYSDVIAIWKKSPEWQYFCGEQFLNKTFPLHDASLSIWSRVIGTQGRAAMTRALGAMREHQRLH